VPQVVCIVAVYVLLGSIVIAGALAYVWGTFASLGTVATQPAGNFAGTAVVVVFAADFDDLWLPRRLRNRNSAMNGSAMRPAVIADRRCRLRLSAASRASRARRAFSFFRCRFSARAIGRAAYEVARRSPVRG